MTCRYRWMREVVGENDPVQLMHAILASRIFVTHNHDDFKELPELVVMSGGHHPGICVIRRDNDPTRYMTVQGIVRAIAKLETSGVPNPDEFNMLNHWR